VLKERKGKGEVNFRFRFLGGGGERSRTRTGVIHSNFRPGTMAIEKKKEKEGRGMMTFAIYGERGRRGKERGERHALTPLYTRSSA